VLSFPRALTCKFSMLLQYDNGPLLNKLVIAYCIVMLSQIGNERLIIMKDERDIINIVWSMCRAAEWKGNWNVTYWRQKDSAPLSKLSGLSSLCKPQGESEYISRCTPGRLEVPASQSSTLLRSCNKICDFLEPETLCLFFFDYPDFSCP